MFPTLLRRLRLTVVAVASAAMVGVGCLTAAPAAAATPPASVASVITAAENVQGDTIGQVEAAWKTSGIWKRYGSEWCAWFDTYLLRNNGIPFTSGDFWVPTLWNTYAKHSRAKTNGKPTVGSLIFYGTPGVPGSQTHVALVVGVSATGVPRTIDGNTGYESSRPGYFGGGVNGSPSTSHVNQFLSPWDTVYGYAYPWYSGGYDSKTGSGSTGSGIAKVTQKATGFEAALVNTAGDLWTVGDGGSTEWYAQVAPGTSASVASLGGGGHQVAVQTRQGDLWSLGGEGNIDWSLSMRAKTSPSIASIAGYGTEIAAVNRNGRLQVVGDVQNKNWQQPVRAGTVPSITGLPGGGYEVAFQGGNGSIWTLGSAGNLDWNLPLAATTSPSIAAVGTASPTGYLVAYSGAGGHVVVASAPRKTVDLTKAYGLPAVQNGTSPVIAAYTGAAGPGYVVAVHASNGALWSVAVTQPPPSSAPAPTPTAGPAGAPAPQAKLTQWKLAMRARTTPTIATLPAASSTSSTGYEIGFTAPNGAPFTVGTAKSLSWNARLASGTVPAVG